MERWYKIFLGLSLFLLVACEDFLDRPPLNTITDQEISFSKTEVELYMNKYYGNFPSAGVTEYGIFGLDNSSDNMIQGH